MKDEISSKNIVDFWRFLCSVIGESSITGFTVQVILSENHKELDPEARSIICQIERLIKDG